MFNTRPPTMEEFIEVCKVLAPTPMASDFYDAVCCIGKMVVILDYMSDCPGYCGDVIVVLGSGGPEIVTVFTKDKETGKLNVVASQC